MQNIRYIHSAHKPIYQTIGHSGLPIQIVKMITVQNSSHLSSYLDWLRDDAGVSSAIFWDSIRELGGQLEVWWRDGEGRETSIGTVYRTDQALAFHRNGTLNAMIDPRQTARASSTSEDDTQRRATVWQAASTALRIVVMTEAAIWSRTMHRAQWIVGTVQTPRQAEKCWIDLFV